MGDADFRKYWDDVARKVTRYFHGGKTGKEQAKAKYKSFE